MKAFIVVDVQNDFCPGGALEVKEGDRVVPFINAKRDEFPLVVFTQDWHPQNHKSFASNNPGTQPGDVIQMNGMEQIMWPDHCVQESHGAEFHPQLERRPDDPVFRKGDIPELDSYSGFRDNDKRRETGLREYLRSQGVDEVHIAGLATDVCVKFTVLDACEFGFQTHVYRDGCRAVNLHPDDEQKAYREMEEAGAIVHA